MEQTNRAVETVKSINPDIVVKGEIGYIGTSSAIHASAQPDMSPLTTLQEAKQFVEATSIDVLAPAVGTMHGMLKSMASGKEHKHLDIHRIDEIKRATRIFLTLHDRSGTDTAELVAGAQAGINIVHIHTELRVAWRRGLEDALTKRSDEIAPYHLLPVRCRPVKVRLWLQTFQRSSSAGA